MNRKKIASKHVGTLAYGGPIIESFLNSHREIISAKCQYMASQKHMCTVCHKKIHNFLFTLILQREIISIYIFYVLVQSLEIKK